MSPTDLRASTHPATFGQGGIPTSLSDSFPVRNDSRNRPMADTRTTYTYDPNGNTTGYAYPGYFTEVMNIRFVRRPKPL